MIAAKIRIINTKQKTLQLRMNAGVVPDVGYSKSDA